MNTIQFTGYCSAKSTHEHHTWAAGRAAFTLRTPGSSVSAATLRLCALAQLVIVCYAPTIGHRWETQTLATICRTTQFNRTIFVNSIMEKDLDLKHLSMLNGATERTNAVFAIERDFVSGRTFAPEAALQVGAATVLTHTRHRTTLIQICVYHLM